MARIVAALVAFFLLPSMLLPAAAQERWKGISVHQLPKRVADLGGWAWGFRVSMIGRERVSSPPTIQTADALLAFYREQDPSVQENGIWIVVTDPDAYSQAEKDLLESVKLACRKNRVPLFICRAIRLPDGWMRYDR